MSPINSTRSGGQRAKTPPRPYRHPRDEQRLAQQRLTNEQQRQAGELAQMYDLLAKDAFLGSDFDGRRVTAAVRSGGREDTLTGVLRPTRASERSVLPCADQMQVVVLEVGATRRLLRLAFLGAAERNHTTGSWLVGLTPA